MIVSVGSLSHWSGTAPLTKLSLLLVKRIRRRPPTTSITLCVFYFRHSDII
nr:MAG TPA: hypothetical protein [Caudoviricetes sp.]